MAESVVDCLTSNFGQFGRDQRVQATRLTINLNFIFDGMSCRKFSAIAGNQLREVSLSELLLGYVKKHLSPFRHNPVRVVKHFFKGLPDRNMFRKIAGCRVKAQKKALDSLKESVVQIPRDILSLGEPLLMAKVKKRRYMPKPEDIDRPKC